MYHYVRPTDPELPYFRHLELDDFKQQLQYFGTHYGYVSKADFIRALTTPASCPGIVLTFDDGFKDHYRFVLPCLQALGLWGIFYIPTGVYHRGKLLDVHRIHMLLGKCGGAAIFDAMQTLITEDMLSDRRIEAFRKQTYLRQHNDDYTNTVKRTLNYYISYQYRESIIDALIDRFLPNEQAWMRHFYLSLTEIRQMQSAGMVIGSHTVNHPVMSKLSKELQRQEIEYSFNLLEAITEGLNWRTFCYPYGGFHTFTTETEALLEASRCQFAFNVEPRDIEDTDLNYRRQALPRYDCNQFPFGTSRISAAKDSAESSVLAVV